MSKFVVKEQESVVESISVIGVGRLGLCVSLVLDRAGYSVIGVDRFTDYTKSLNERTFTSHEPHVNTLLSSARKFRATTDLDEALNHSDLIFIFVDTPTGVDENSYDHSNLSRVLQQIDERKVHGKHVVIGCTVLPTYTQRVGRFLLSHCTHTTLNYNPEFIAQGAIIEGLIAPDFVLIGEQNELAGSRIESVYRRLCASSDVAVHRMSVESAEICKLSVNAFVTMKIAFCNAIADVADRTNGAEKYAILKAVGADSRIGQKALKPGYGYGGPCFPRDNRALGNFAAKCGAPLLLSQATDLANKQHTEFQAQKFLSEERDLYVFEDVCYKSSSPVPIIENSQKLEVARKLAVAGKHVKIVDAKVVIKAVMAAYGDIFQYEERDDQ